MITRLALDHVLRAAASITGQRRFVIIGSAVAVANIDDPPPDMLQTREIDLYAPDAPDIEHVSDLIDGSIGSGSIFEETFGYAADGVSPGTAILPPDWESRASVYASPESGGATAIIPSIEDIAISKLVAWREKDRSWIAACLKRKLGSPENLRRLLTNLPDISVPRSELERRLDVVIASASARDDVD